MNVRWVVGVVVLSAAGCLCSGPPTGECSGAWAGVTYDKANLDLSSRMVIVRGQTCADPDLKRYDISWADGGVAFSATLFGGPSILGGTQYALPPDAGSGLLTFSFSPDPPAPSGTLELGISGIQGRRTGTLSVSNGSQSLTCTFDVPYDTEGPNLSCGGSGDDD